MVVLIALALLAGLLPIFVTGKPSHGAGTIPDGFEQSRFVGELTNPTAMVLVTISELRGADSQSRQGADGGKPEGS
jgi:hypothetical protein